MNSFRAAKYYGAASVLLPVAAIVIKPSWLWLHAGLIIWVAAAAAWWIVIERKEHEARMAKLITASQTSSIRTLNHHRHDWMNDLQVLYGYIRMGKLDRTVDYVEKIRDRMAAESKIARLGVPSLISYIQSFRTLTSSLQLDVIIDDDIALAELPIDSERTADTLIEVINAYRFAVKPSGGEAAVLTLHMKMDDKELLAAFYYQGELSGQQEQWSINLQRRLIGAPLQPVRMDKPHEQLLLRADLSA
ncbi:Spo0B domain-containing protein [Paenibacillus sp. GCM10023252]|uniref:Spo0B domain-containing protein n=1 Tax=Paenibacillus sp. GCM10023252 TaxID=3252649 RepID=UPI00361432E4